MKVPVSWLKEYVDIEDTPQGLADILTFSGVEVEGIETIGGEYAGLVVASVRAVAPHPHADRLTVCRVWDGSDEVQVVCGAPNVRTGLKAAFAPVGAVLPNGVKMKRAKIRQVESLGMLLAEDELGLSDEHAGLLELDDRWEAGTPLSDVLPPPETVLDLEITPNRPDCLCLLGIAREVAALYGTSLRFPDVQVPESDAPADARISVTVEDAAACPRYTARVLREVDIKPSPEWMQRRLALAGIRPINNVVDITNYVMLETGHPLHAFDQRLLKEGRVVVRRARDGEVIRTLDDQERKLTSDMLVIADADAPVAVAGVMGGGGSEIRPDTTTVLLESACFDPLRTRRTSRDLALSTESSYRFERGVDAATVEWASRRATALMMEWAGAQPAAGVRDVYPAPAPARTITCRWDFVRELTGMSVDNETIRRWLTAIELVFTQEDTVSFTVRVPSFRGDLERAVDVVEEVARLHGLDQIPTPRPAAQIMDGADDRAIRSRIRLRDRLVGLGLREIMNYSLTSCALLDLFDRENRNQRVVLPHPISADQSILRPSLLPQMAETVGRNWSRQMEETLFFECGRTYAQGGAGSVQEADRVAIGLMGPVGRGPFERRRPVEPAEMFAWMKGLLEQLLSAQGGVEWTVRVQDEPWAEPGRAIGLFTGETCWGVMGLLHARIRREWRITGPVALAELEVSPLLAQDDRVPRAQAVPVFPAIARDMALWAGPEVTHDDVVRVIQKNAQKELEKIELFDIFEDDAQGVPRKSMAYRLLYRSGDKTLTDEEANVYHERVKGAIKRELGVTVREG